MEQNRICEIISEIQPLFKNYIGNSWNAKVRAQDALSGLTHYVDNDTLKFFNARINKAFSVSGGLFFVVYESVAIGWKGSRVHRFKMFDVFGRVIGTPDSEFPNSKQVDKAFWSWYNDFNANEYYRQVIADKYLQAKDRAKKLSDLFDSLIYKG